MAKREEMPEKTVIFCHDTFYCRSSDQEIYAYGAFPYALWANRFLPHFDRLKIIGRNKGACEGDQSRLDKSSGPQVEHILLDNINSPLKRLMHGRRLYKKIYDHIRGVDGVIIRGPVEFGMMAAKAARALGKPYAVEMSGCAFDHTWHHGSLIGKLYAPLKYWRARHMVAKADQVIYVTEHFLQKRYPAAGLTEFASNVEIIKPAQEVLDKRIKHIQDRTGPLKIGLIGNYGNALKGLDVALAALGHLKRKGYDFTLHVLGKGDPAMWEPAIIQQGLAGKIIFDGTLPGGQPVLQWLDDMDIYIQPSRHEGLPRAVIEAMSRALPCIVSNAGGTDELLPQEWIHKKDDAHQLYRQLKKMCKDTDLQLAHAQTNFAKAKAYTKEVLAPRRAAFWKQFKTRL